MALVGETDRRALIKSLLGRGLGIPHHGRRHLIGGLIGWGRRLLDPGLRGGAFSDPGLRLPLLGRWCVRPTTSHQERDCRYHHDSQPPAVRDPIEKVHLFLLSYLELLALINVLFSDLDCRERILTLHVLLNIPLEYYESD
jgi:hypothetical protein